MRKRTYYNRKALFDTGADYLMVFGQNCSGKSYQGKEECIMRALKGERFFFLRRWQPDLNQNIATSYFDDMPVSKYTNGEWDSIVARSGEFFFQRADENGKLEKSDCIGYYGVLTFWQRYKSNVYLNCTFMLFEEFITDGVYLTDEPLLLQRLVTTVFRDHKGQVMMIGNTISRTVPYFMEWCPNVPKQKQNTIELYHMKDATGEGVEVLIACEYGGHIKGTGLMNFGEATKSIMSGEWSVTNQPRLPKEYLLYENVYELLIRYQQFGFVLQLLIDPEEGTKLLFVYPWTKKRKIERIITDEFSDDLMVSRYFKDNRPEALMRECLINKRVCYSDNLTASDFLSVYDQMGL